MQGWLGRWNEKHKPCPKQNIEPQLSTRVLEVGLFNDKPCLLESDGKRGRWTALSHCWGGGLQVKTTTSNRALHCAGTGLTLEELPPTFRDAIRIVRKLGIPYLWTDALRIVQDDPGDWQREAKCIDYVYSNATVTLAAEASPNSTTGVLCSMQESRGPPKSLVHSSCYSRRMVVEE